MLLVWLTRMNLAARQGGGKLQLVTNDAELQSLLATRRQPSTILRNTIFVLNNCIFDRLINLGKHDSEKCHSPNAKMTEIRNKFKSIIFGRIARLKVALPQFSTLVAVHVKCGWDKQRYRPTHSMHGLS